MRTIHRIANRSAFVRSFSALVVSAFMLSPWAVPAKGFSDAQEDKLSRKSLNVLLNVKKNEGFIRAKVVKLKDKAFSGLREDVELFDGKTVAFVATSVRQEDDTRIWLGTVDGASNSQFILFVREGSVSGRFLIGKRLYTIEPLGDGNHAIVEHDNEAIGVEQDM